MVRGQFDDGADPLADGGGGQAGAPPALVVERAGGQVGAPPVLEEPAGPAVADLALDARRGGLVVGDDAELDPGDRVAVGGGNPGDWEMAVVTTPARPQAERVALRKAMIDLRLAELREGVWIRPDNLVRQLGGVVGSQCKFFRCEYPEHGELTQSLWDLPGWASTARHLQGALVETTSLRDGFMLIAQVVRHLRLDPFLPPELLPDDWPGQALRESFTEFRDQFAQRLREYSIG
jgi:PaaX-like protein C-terminal domain